MDTNRHSLFTSNFREYGIFLQKLGFMFMIVLIIFSHFIPSYSGEYAAALIDKVERLESIEGAKIVLIGNSNVAYGFKSELIEEKFGLPVVNMGFHGDFGNVFHEEMTKLNVCEGDIYIICHSDYTDLGKIDHAPLVWAAIENHPRLWRILRAEDIWPVLKGFPVYLKKCINRDMDGIRNQEGLRDAFNEYGDICINKETGSDLFYEGAVYIPNISVKVMQRINRLDKYLEKRGATLLIAGYPIGDGEYTPDKENFSNYRENLQTFLTCPVISDFTDYMFDYKYFYNSSLHLNEDGAVLRTEQLIEDLERYFQETK